MQKTIRFLLLLTIISGVLFTACEKDTAVPAEGESDVEEIMDADVVDDEEGERDDEKDASVDVDAKVDAKVETKVIAKNQPAAQPKVEGKGEPVTQDQKQPEVSRDPEPKVQEPKAPAPVEPVTIFNDGAYSFVGSYNSPAGPETIGVNLTVANDVVTAVNVTPNGTHTTTKQFQGLFASGISGQVVGKKLDQIGSFSQVNGSSLTPQAFNKAIAGIKAAAKK